MPRLDRCVLDAALGWVTGHPEQAAGIDQCSINIGSTTLVDEDFGDYFGFVGDLDNAGLSEAVVLSITGIANVLGKRAVAEQVETQSQLEHLHAIGVDFAQGYVFQRPQPIDTFFATAAPG